MSQKWRLRMLTADQPRKIASTQPYNNEDKWTSLLSDLSNRDEHRHPIELYKHSRITVSVSNHETVIVSDPPRWTQKVNTLR